MASAQILSKETVSQVPPDIIDGVLDLRNQIADQQQIGETGGPVSIRLLEPILAEAGIRVESSEDPYVRGFVEVTNMFVQSQRRNGQEVVNLPHTITKNVLRIVGASMLRAVQIQKVA
jgi:hypothetical protein